MPEPVRYRNKGAKSVTGMLCYRTEIHDAGMPMPAASMPMPSYSWLQREKIKKRTAAHTEQQQQQLRQIKLQKKKRLQQE
jgi:hypothetical protein